MSRLPGWLERLGRGLSRMGERLDERRAEAEREDPLGPLLGPTYGEDEDDRATARPAPAYEKRPAVPEGAGDAPAPAPAAPGHAVETHGAAETRGAAETHGEPVPSVPAPPTYAPAVAARPDPVAAIPWGMRVAAEASWRLLVLAGTVWVLMKVISSVQLVVLAFVAALLVTALLQPTVAMLRRKGLPRGLATAVTAVSGFVVMGLVGWFVVWQVMDNIDNLSDRVRDGIEELKTGLLNSPFHVTEQQINGIAKNLSDSIGANAEQITTVGFQGVTVLVEVITGILLAMFSTLFLLYDGKKVWEWTLKLVPAQARPGVAGAGPRAWRTLTAYVRGTVLVALIDAVFIGLGLWFLDVPMAVPLAVFIFLFAFIPLVGAVISGALAVVVALVTNGLFTALMVLVVVLAVQQIEGHVLQPFILGRAVRVHPLAVVLAVAAGGLTAGIGGAVVAVPLVAVSNTVVGYLRAYSTEQALRTSPEPRGATAFEVAPTPAPGAAKREGGA
ncbi:AI-2E family transporter [Streptomyces sp. NPDC020807]|uniref:AI-2E family transporter n=1 Tax=Streptomyces sp. NPDC020807 TaxID=3155119 RepID=UPI0033D5FAA7